MCLKSGKGDLKRGITTMRSLWQRKSYRNVRSFIKKEGKKITKDTEVVRLVLQKWQVKIWRVHTNHHAKIMTLTFMERKKIFPSENDYVGWQLISSLWWTSKMNCVFEKEIFLNEEFLFSTKLMNAFEFQENLTWLNIIITRKHLKIPQF